MLTFGLAFWRITLSGSKWTPDAFLVAGLGLLAWSVWQARRTGSSWNKKLPEEIVFLTAAFAIFIAGMLFSFAEWGWDNLKLMIWGYFLVLPYLWKDLIARWNFPERVAICVALFGSGFVSLLGGLSSGHPGFDLIDRARLDAIGLVVRPLPIESLPIPPTTIRSCSRAEKSFWVMQAISGQKASITKMNRRGFRN